MLNTERSTTTDDILSEDGYEVSDLKLTVDRLAWIWMRVQNYRTLYSDLSDHSADAFMRLITSPGSLWYQVMLHEELVGIMYVNNFAALTDCEAHFFFFDKKPSAKVKVVKAMIKRLFAEMPSLSRITVKIPEIYFSTKRLVIRIGFQQEGIIRKGILIGGRLHNIVQYGLLREEAFDG